MAPKLKDFLKQTNASPCEIASSSSEEMPAKKPRCQRRLDYETAYKTPPCSETGEYIHYTYDHVTESKTKLSYFTSEVEAACNDDIFGETISRLVERQPICKQISFNAVIPLAHLLVEAGCSTASGLWIAIKFSSKRRYTPAACLMASVCEISKKTLVAQEANAFKKLDWDIAPYARLCSLIY